MKVERSTKGLRDLLFAQLDGLKDGTISSRDAKANSDVCGRIVQVAKLEMQIAKQNSGHEIKSAKL